MSISDKVPGCSLQQIHLTVHASSLITPPSGGTYFAILMPTSQGTRNRWSSVAAPYKVLLVRYRSFVLETRPIQAAHPPCRYYSTVLPVPRYPFADAGASCAPVARVSSSIFYPRRPRFHWLPRPFPPSIQPSSTHTLHTSPLCLYRQSTSGYSSPHKFHHS